MSEQKQAAWALGSTEGLGPLPEPDVPLVRGGCYTEVLVRKIVAERVAAERERCAKVCEALLDKESDYDEWAQAHNAGLETAAKAIRRAELFVMRQPAA